METVSSDEKPGFSRDCRMLFNYLVDAFQCTINLATYQRKLDETNSKLKLDLNSVEDLKSYVQDLNKTGTVKFGPELFKETGSKITEFSTAALEQLKAKISTAVNQKVIDIEGSIASEKTKFMKDVEAYLASLVQPTIQSKTTVKWNDGSYEGKALYSVSTKISPNHAAQKKGILKSRESQPQVSESLSLEYQFLLRTDDIDLFNDTLYFSDFEKGMKIPVRHAVSWITKEAVVDSEKVDRYFLNFAEFSGNSLIAEFADKDKAAKFRLVYHTADSESFLNVEYSDASGTVDLQSQPALNQNLETDKLKEIMKVILGPVSELVKHRSKLVSLSINSEDILSNTNSSLLLSSMIKFLSAFYGKSVAEIISDQPTPPEGMISSEFVKSKLQLLGDAEGRFSEMLEHNYSLKTPQNDK